MLDIRIRKHDAHIVGNRVRGITVGVGEHGFGWIISRRSGGILQESSVVWLDHTACVRDLIKRVGMIETGGKDLEEHQEHESSMQMLLFCGCKAVDAGGADVVCREAIEPRARMG